MIDQLIRATAAKGGIRAVGAITTKLTEEARHRHQLSHVATAALGRTMTAGLLLASGMKQPQSRVNLRIRGAGPLKSVMVDAGLDGTVRGYVGEPQIELPPNAQGKLDVGGAIGPGYLYVIRDVGYGYPYTSTVELVSGEIGDDVTYYLAHSEQTPSAMALGVLTEKDGVRAAGGLLIQILPKAANNEPLVSLLESRIATLQGFTPMLEEGLSLTAIFERLLGDLGLVILPNTQLLQYHCPCSFPRLLSALKVLGEAELQDMIEKDGGAESTCDFCNEVYDVSVQDLEQVIQMLRA
jgi:molecular chaperone Hsp33